MTLVHALGSLSILHGHTRIFHLGLFVDSCTSPSSNFATIPPLCALCKNEISVSLWVWNTQTCFPVFFATFFEFESLTLYVAQE